MRITYRLLEIITPQKEKRKRSETESRIAGKEKVIRKAAGLVIWILEFGIWVLEFEFWNLNYEEIRVIRVLSRSPQIAPNHTD